MEDNRPKVGIGVIVIKDNKILLGKRKNAHGEGSWAFPGGHLEFNEAWEDCVRREVKEKVDVEIKNIRFGAVTNDIFAKEGKHYITISMVTDYDAGEVKTMEPEKCEYWEWFEWDKLPEPRFIPLQNLLKQNFDPFK
ncbi:MAG: NUDIX hydrolase [Patescibacteria group bacterium]|jgi:8-oxo-dGTP diphosphatase